MTENNPIPVILDTDIGTDIDDTWAIAMMLKSPELDVKLIVSDSGDTTYRSKLIARMLEIAGRVDVPVGLGMHFEGQQRYPQGPWVADYSFGDYPGIVHQDGVGAIIDTIMNSPEPITLICIGPVPNIAEALKREPRIVGNARFVGMHGSVYKGYHGSEKISAEYNVVQDVTACQKVFSASWDMTITPIDTCELVVLQGEVYQSVRHSSDPFNKAIMENYRLWLEDFDRSADFEVKSSRLFDTVAVYLAFTEKLLVMENLKIRVTDDGYTVVDEDAKQMNVAVDWKDLPAFEKILVDRLTG
jgi:inosine-uridine nucleoside N-ribohydrolase